MILDEGAWLMPRLFDQHLELQKPPLYYWLVAIFGWLGGGQVGPWAVRLPAALSASACVFFVFFLGSRAGRPLAGFLSAVVLGSCVHFTWLAQVGRIDMPLTLTITMALGGFYLCRLENRRLWCVFAFASIGVGMLLKGPIAAVLPAVVIATWVAGSASDRMRPAFTSLCWGVPLTLLIAAPWYVWANLHTDNQLWEVFFWHHNVERGLGGSAALANHPWWYYGPRAVIDLSPWSLLAPVAIWWLIRNREMRDDVGLRLGLIWFLSITAFLSFVRFKRSDYLLPAYPGFALFLGGCFDRWWQSRRAPVGQTRTATSSLARAAGMGVTLYAAAWTVWSACGVSIDERPDHYRDMAHEIRSRTQKPVVFFRAESHRLAYHLGRPVTTILEWENLAIWAAKPFPVYVVMPEANAREWREHLPADALEEVLRTSDYIGAARERPLVILRSRGIQ
jgi:4-amino-4-deoxy-L-arabinose transferase-like glycosyltransferase